jgi:hypothetical protein
MVHCRIVTTYTISFDATKDYIIVKHTRDHHEIGRIPYMKEWHRDGSG